MKKTIYLLTACVLAFAGTSCNSDDPNKATEKHVYGEGEAPYLKSNPAATNELSLEFPLAKIDKAQTIRLKDYADCFHKQLNMTVDEAMTALANGEAVFSPINTGRQCWDMTPANFGDNGWYFNPNGVGNAENGVFTISLDPASKTVKIEAVGVPEVGTIAALDFGLALVNGKDYDKYVRFSANAVVTDPSKVVISAVIPAGEYNAYEIDFRDYPDAFRLSMGMEIDEAIKAMDNDLIDIYMIDANGERVVDENGERPEYTSGWGYWLDSDLNITGWSGDGYPANLMFTEYWGDGIFALGNSASSTPSGTQCTLRFDLVSVENPEAFVQFVIGITFE